ncbi:unnamed protein product, partial [Phaeothamnion confervicola]
CLSCYADLKEAVPIQMGDVVLRKSDLLKKKNDELNREDSGNLAPTASKFGGKDLRHTRMSQFIEGRVNSLLEGLYETEATARGVPLAQVERGGTLHVRQVSVQDVRHVVRPMMSRRYHRRGGGGGHGGGGGATGGFPDEFPARSKCTLLFQDVDGVDVLLFGMYVYEYGHSCPEPNSRRVYISYLDSVHYFRPRRYRTEVYHEILVAYLEYVKQRGFHTAHLWACPPLKGDDYILYCHPEDQKTPKDDRLQQWYVNMLEKGGRRGIVERVTNLYDEYWTDPDSQATALPYFEGDYWVGEVSQSLSLAVTTQLTFSRYCKTQQGVLSRRETGWNALLPLAAVVGGGSWALSEMEESEGIVGGGGVGGPSQKSDPSKKGRKSSKRQAARAAERMRHSSDELMQRLGEIIEPMKQGFIVAYLRPREFVQQCRERRRHEADVEHARELVEQLRAAGQQPDPATLALAEAVIATDETAENEEETMDCEHLDTRQVFLNLCQGNHYQFDQLRRAKHSSMMVLYHLCNPDAPKFLSSCTVCLREINAGNRYACAQGCEDYNLCEDCYRKNPSQHPHRLKPVPVRREANAPQMTEQQRRERQRSIQLHMQLLQHASTCQDPRCPSQNCTRMKGLLTHGTTCNIRAGGGCQICRRIWALLQIHARQCKRSDCNVPKCQQLREHLRQLALQQQQMDDRRRQAMNDYHRQRQQGPGASAGGA